MGDKVIEFDIPLDDEGYVTLNCPFCKEPFKITARDYKAEEIYQLFCPYCGLVSESGFLSRDDVREVAENLVQNEINKILNEFSKNMENSFKNSKHIKFNAGKKREMKEIKRLVELNDAQEIEFRCCNKKIKVEYDYMDFYCPFCGGK